MFTSPNPKTLRATLDCIPVAMFAADRPTYADAFRLVCINRAHEDESGLSDADVAGLRPMDLLPPDEAERVESRYSFCAQHDKVIQYREVLHLQGQPTFWQTILHPVKMAGQMQRIIGTAFAIAPDGAFPAALPAIHAAMANLREAATTEPLPVVSPAPLAPAARIAGGANIIPWHLSRPYADPVKERAEAG